MIASFMFLFGQSYLLLDLDRCGFFTRHPIMMRNSLSKLVLSLALCLPAGDVIARGFGGGGGGGGRMGGGGGGGMSRPAPRPSAPNLGGGGGMSRPNVSAPSVNRPVSRPATPPQISRPSGGGGGIKPSMPATRPSLPANRPSTLPGNVVGGGGLPTNKLPGTVNRPATRPSVPNLGGGAGGNRPNLPGNGATTRPALPGTGNGNRPSPGDLGDFLGMDKPIGKVPGFDRPTTRPNLPGDRPNVNNRPVNVNRPIDIGNIKIGNNTAISNRPSWVNMDKNQYNNVNNRWQNQVGGLHNWNTRYPARAGYWHGWADGVRHSNNWHGHYHGCFGPNWWGGHYHPCGGWHYGYGFGRYNWNYWWTVPTYVGLTNWFRWTAPAEVWSEPVYYDYGSGGNVTYTENTVYVNGEQVATTDEFAQSAAELATVPPPPSEEEAKQAEWMSLGTFAVSRGEKDVEPNLVVQLAVNKDGVVSGTLFDTTSDKAQTVQGQVDKQTQRLAVRIGENEDLIAETGLYNLTLEEAPVLVHYGKDKVENWLLVRLETPPEEAGEQPAP